MNSVEVHINQVRTACSVEVGQEQAFGIKVNIEQRRILHGDAFAKVAIPKVRPIVDPAIVNQDHIIETIAGHVSETYSPGRIVEENIRELVEVMYSPDELWRCKSLLAKTFEP